MHLSICSTTSPPRIKVQPDQSRCLVSWNKFISNCNQVIPPLHGKIWKNHLILKIHQFWLNGQHCNLTLNFFCFNVWRLKKTVERMPALFCSAILLYEIFFLNKTIYFFYILVSTSTITVPAPSSIKLAGIKYNLVLHLGSGTFGQVMSSQMLQIWKLL